MSSGQFPRSTLDSIQLKRTIRALYTAAAILSRIRPLWYARYMNHPVLRRLAFPLISKRVHLIEGLEHVPHRGPFIVASNHVSYLDPPILYAILARRVKQKIHFFTKREVINGLTPLVSMRWFGMIPVDQDQPTECLERARKFLERGKIVGIFPEARRNTDHALLKAKTGVARLALWTGAPVLPIGFFGPPAWTVREALKNFFGNHGEVQIHIGAPITFPHTSPELMTKDLLTTVTRTIMQRIAELSHKVYLY